MTAMQDESDLSQFVPDEIGERLRDLQHPSFDLWDVLAEIQRFSRMVWQEGTLLFDYTDHTLSHSKRIIEYVYHLAKLLPTEERLSPLEWFGLLSAAFLHDIGMQWTVLLREYAPREDRNLRENWDTIRRCHVSRSCKLISAIVMQDGPLGEAFPALAYFKNNKGDYSTLLKRITTIIAAHSRDQSGQESGWREALQCSDIPPRSPGSGDRFRVRLVASLFRLADELDVTDQRIPNHSRLFNDAVDQPSLLHWAACFFVSTVKINPEKRQFRLIVDKSRLPTEERLLEVAHHLIVNFVHEKIKRAFLKSLTLDTISIQRVLLSCGMPLIIEDPRFVGGIVTGTAQTTGFLHSVARNLHLNILPCSVPFKSYSISGYRSTPEEPTTGGSVRVVRLIDESAFVRVPGDLKHAFASSQNLRSSEALAFLRTTAVGSDEGRVTVYSETGETRTAATSAVLAAAAHIDKPQVSLKIGRNTYGVSQYVDGFCIEMGRSRRPFRATDGTDFTVADSDYSRSWQEAHVDLADNSFVQLMCTRLRGVHGIILTTANQYHARIFNFFDEFDLERRRELWLQRAHLIEDISRQVCESLPGPVLTISIMEASQPFRLLTYSTEANSAISFSGGATAAAGYLGIELFERIVEGYSHLWNRDEFFLTAWHDPTQLFKVTKTNRGVALACRVRKCLDGRAFE